MPLTAPIILSEFLRQQMKLLEREYRKFLLSSSGLLAEMVSLLSRSTRRQLRAKQQSKLQSTDLIVAAAFRRCVATTAITPISGDQEISPWMSSCYGND